MDLIFVNLFLVFCFIFFFLFLCRFGLAFTCSNVFRFSYLIYSFFVVFCFFDNIFYNCLSFSVRVCLYVCSCERVTCKICL